VLSVANREYLHSCFAKGAVEKVCVNANYLLTSQQA